MLIRPCGLMARAVCLETLEDLARVQRDLSLAFGIAQHVLANAPTHQNGSPLGLGFECRLH